MEIDSEATERLRERVVHWAERLCLKPQSVRLQKMSKKWGSCSSAGTVTLGRDLARHDEQFQDVVIVHELLHLHIHNHGKLFCALMTAHVPHWRATTNGIKLGNRRHGKRL